MIFIFTIFIAWFIFTLLVKIIKTTVKTAFMVAAVIVFLQVGYNISPFDVLNYIMQLPQTLSQIGVGK